MLLLLSVTVLDRTDDAVVQMLGELNVGIPSREEAGGIHPKAA